jgi:hypothetical protein
MKCNTPSRPRDVVTLSSKVLYGDPYRRQVVPKKEQFQCTGTEREYFQNFPSSHCMPGMDFHRSIHEPPCALLSKKSILTLVWGRGKGYSLEAHRKRTPVHIGRILHLSQKQRVPSRDWKFLFPATNLSLLHPASLFSPLAETGEDIQPVGVSTAVQDAQAVEDITAHPTPPKKKSAAGQDGGADGRRVGERPARHFPADRLAAADMDLSGKSTPRVFSWFPPPCQMLRNFGAQVFRVAIIHRKQDRFNQRPSSRLVRTQWTKSRVSLWSRRLLPRQNPSADIT